jgi:hypothetical protein
MVLLMFAVVYLCMRQEGAGEGGGVQRGRNSWRAPPAPTACAGRGLLEANPSP